MYKHLFKKNLPWPQTNSRNIIFTAGYWGFTNLQWSKAEKGSVKECTDILQWNSCIVFSSAVWEKHLSIHLSIQLVYYLYLKFLSKIFVIF